MRKLTIHDLRVWHIAVAIQYLVIGTALVIPVGFDHPSRLGLSFDHGLVIGLACAVLTLVAVLLAIGERSVVGVILATAPIWGPIVWMR